GQLRPGEDLATKAREARVADLILVLFSRKSLPPRWRREQWEDAFINEPKEENVRIAFARCDDCVPPRVLAPMFDLSGQSLKALRQVKRWVRGALPGAGLAVPELDLLGIAIADRSGRETVESAAIALEFVDAFRQDFDGV